MINFLILAILAINFGYFGNLFWQFILAILAIAQEKWQMTIAILPKSIAKIAREPPTQECVLQVVQCVLECCQDNAYHYINYMCKYSK